MGDLREPEGYREFNSRKSLSSHLMVSEASQQMGWTLGISLSSRQHVTLEMMQCVFTGLGLNSPGNLPLMVKLNREGHITFWNGFQQNRLLRITSPH